MSHIMSSSGIYLDRKISEASAVAASHEFGVESTDQYKSTLTTKERHAAFASMRDNQPLIGGFLNAITTLLGQPEWTLEAGDGPDAARALEILQRSMERIDAPISPRTFRQPEKAYSGSWDVLQDLESALVYGWASPEVTCAIEADGAVVWDEISPRSQDEWTSWLYDESDRFAGWSQNRPGRGVTPIPLWKTLYTEARLAPGRGPGGRSWFEASRRPAYYSERLEDAEALRFEHDAVGLPVYQVPQALLDPNASATVRSNRREKELFVQKIRRGKYEGILVPHKLTPNNTPSGYELSLMASAGSPMSSDNAIKRHSVNMLVPPLAQFLSLGRETGSFALADNFTDLFALSAGVMLERKARALQRGISLLMHPTLNNIPKRSHPRFRHGDIESRDIGKFTDAISKLGPAGWLQKTAEGVAYAHGVVGLPPPSPEVIKAVTP